MTGRVLLYGANGFSGRAIAERLAPLGGRLVLGGRDPAKVGGIAERLGLAARSFRLDQPEAMDRALRGVRLVINAAGPYRNTATPMMAACLRAGADYMDLSGEWPVFVSAMARNDAAWTAGVMLVPGAGIAIAVTDCLLAKAAAQAPGAVRLRIAISRPHMLSRGSVRTLLAMADPQVLVRRQGRLETLPAGALARDFDFGKGRRRAVAFSWPDVVTAPVTTGVPDIEAYCECDWASRTGLRLASGAAGAFRAEPIAETLGQVAGAWPERPRAEVLERAGYTLVAEAEDRWRRTTSLRLTIADGYSVTVDVVEAMARRILAGERRPGFQTPGGLFGPSLLDEIATACAGPVAA